MFIIQHILFDINNNIFHFPNVCQVFSLPYYLRALVRKYPSKRTNYMNCKPGSGSFSALDLFTHRVTPNLSMYCLQLV